ncbi:MAG: transposase [Pseudonocardiaceae bacterium]
MADELGEPVHDATPRPAPPDARTRVPPTLVLRRETLPLQPIRDFVTLVGEHWDGLISWHANHLSNGLLEGINSLVQAAKTRARGYRSKMMMITIGYLTAAKLQLPTLTPVYMSSR